MPAGKGYLYLQSDSDDIYIDTGAAKKIYFRQGASTYSNFTSTGLSIGYGTTTAAAKLDIKAQGALSTDIAFRVRNSADTANIVTIQGDGAFTVGTYTSPNTKLSVTGTTFGAYITGNTGIYAQSNVTSGTLYAIDCLGRASSGANTSYGIKATSDTTGVGSTNFAGRFNAYNGATNYAGYFDATGGTNNYALVTQRGFSGFNKLDPSAIVDIKAAGVLSTDIALRVRNSADTANLFSVQGDGVSNVLTRFNCGFSGMTTTGGALHVYAGNSNDFISRWFNTAGAGVISIRTVSNGGQLIISDNTGTAGLTLDGQNSNALTFGAGRNIYFDTATGTKIGATTSQKFAFWNATPIVQPTTAVTPATVVSGSGGNVKHDDTFDGYTVEQVVRALRNTGLLA